MSEIEKIRTSIAEARERLSALTEAAELAADRGSRGPTPADIAGARYQLARREQQLQLAVAKAAASPIPYRSIR